MPRFLIGDIRQGFVSLDPKVERKHWQIGDIVDPRQRNVLFLSDEYEASDFLDFPRDQTDARRKLRDVGNAAITIVGIIPDPLGDGRMALLEHTDESRAQQQRIQQILAEAGYEDFPFRDTPVLTMTANTRLEVGNMQNTMYLTVLELLGDSLYKIRHDYPTLPAHNNQRYEFFKDE